MTQLSLILYLEHTTKPDVRQRLFQHMKDLHVYGDKNLGRHFVMKMGEVDETLSTALEGKLTLDSDDESVTVKIIADGGESAEIVHCKKSRLIKQCNYFEALFDFRETCGVRNDGTKSAVVEVKGLDGRLTSPARYGHYQVSK